MLMPTSTGVSGGQNSSCLPKMGESLAYRATRRENTSGALALPLLDETISSLVKGLEVRNPSISGLAAPVVQRKTCNAERMRVCFADEPVLPASGPVYRQSWCLLCLC